MEFLSNFPVWGYLIALLTLLLCFVMVWAFCYGSSESWEDLENYDLGDDEYFDPERWKN